MSAPLLIVGTGIAGLCAALAAAPHPVVLIGRSRPMRDVAADAATALAQGGIAAALASDDSCEAHAEDTLAAGALHNDAAAVQFLCESAPAAIEWLQDQGVVFDRVDGRLALAREGGHRCARVAHAGGDASGARLLDALTAQARRARHISWRLGAEVDGLLMRGDVAAGVRLRGAMGQDFFLTGAAVILATGGIGGLFATTTNPVSAQGRGLALALAANARLRDLEFIQFHPTALAASDDVRLPLLTEALRGAGAQLRDRHGQALCNGVHVLGDLAPRDVVARAVASAVEEGRGAFLHAEQLALDWPSAFPTAWAQCRAAGLDPRLQPLPVQAAAHFHMGGIEVDLHGRSSSVPGLYAVGEVACNGVHGANRLASNSLLEGVVFGRRVGAFAARAGAPLATPSTRRTVWIAAAGPALTTHRLTWLRRQLSAALGPARRPQRIAELQRRLTADPALACSAQGRVALALLVAAAARRASLGAHHWSDPCVEVQGIPDDPRVACCAEPR
jgi:L-aspartate oxidase